MVLYECYFYDAVNLTVVMLSPKPLFLGNTHLKCLWVRGSVSPTYSQMFWGKKIDVERMIKQMWQNANSLGMRVKLYENSVS